MSEHDPERGKLGTRVCAVYTVDGPWPPFFHLCARPHAGDTVVLVGHAANTLSPVVGRFRVVEVALYGSAFGREMAGCTTAALLAPFEKYTEAAEAEWMKAAEFRLEPEFTDRASRWEEAQPQKDNDTVSPLKDKETR